MPDTERDNDGLPGTDAEPGTMPNGAPDRREDDRSDIEQAVEARSDAVDRGEGGDEIDSFGATGMPDGPAGTGGLVKNQDSDQQ